MASGAAAIESGKSLSLELSAVRSFRRILVVCATAPAIAAVVLLFVSNGATPQTCVFGSVSLAVILYSAVVSDSWRTVLQLHGALEAIQRSTIVTGLARVGIFGLLAVSAPGSVSFYLLGLGLVSVVEAASLRRAARSYAHVDEPFSAEDRGRYALGFRQSIVGSIFVILGGQTVTAALTVAGNADGIAEVGALTRFAALFLVVNAVISSVVNPFLAKLPSSREAVRREALRVTSVYALISLAYVGGCFTFAPVLLWLLGPEYRALQTELVIIAAGTATSNFAFNGIGAINFSRGWLRYSWSYVPLYFLWVSIAVFAIDLETSVGAALLNSSLALVNLASQAVPFLSGYRRLAR